MASRSTKKQAYSLTLSDVQVLIELYRKFGGDTRKLIHLKNEFLENDGYLPDVFREWIGDDHVWYVQEMLTPLYYRKHSKNRSLIFESVQSHMPEFFRAYVQKYEISHLFPNVPVHQERK